MDGRIYFCKEIYIRITFDSVCQAKAVFLIYNKIYDCYEHN